MKPTALIKPYFVENRFFILAGLVCLIAVDLLQLTIPRIIKWVVDDLTALRIDRKGLLTYALYMVGIGLVIGVLRYAWRRFLLGASRRVEEGLRNDLFAHIQTLSASYFDKTKSGDLMAHATNDIQQIRMATGMGMVALNDAVVLGAAAIGFMAYINVRLTLLVLIPAPLIVFGTRIFSKKMHSRYRQVQGAFSDLTEAIRERLAGIRIIRAYGTDDRETEAVAAVSRAYIRKNLELVRITGAFFPMMLLFSNVSLAIVIYWGGRQTIMASITPGDFVAFISYLGLLTWPMMAMGWVTNLIQRGRASLDRISTILATPPAVSDRPEARPLPSVRGALTFEKVTFAYASAGRPVLDQVSFQVEKGQTVGIIGPPGSGKTTLLNLIPRLYDLNAGRILLDGTDIRDVRLADLRAQIAFLPQEPFIFAASIRENITLGDRGIATTDLIQATRSAALYDTIQALPDGFDTIVGERGIMLSGGQKQRIALTRALIHAAPVMVLDDPISQVDAETASVILKTIRSLAGTCTILIVTHRLAAVRDADQIVMMDAGRIVERGRHEDLMALDGYYARTFQLQAMEENFNAI
jgi:ATP-binding cassette subfamily B protein